VCPRARSIRQSSWALLAVGMMLLSFSAVITAADQGRELTGAWRNPKDSVHVEIARCGQAMCGVVVWASEKAKTDAREGGTDALIGINLLRDFVSAGDGRWRGKVFVPDLGKTVTGTVEMVDADTFRARSCALAVFCKTQLWRRVR
jgi:uncharacterized protein (DUF2147 family)